MADSNYMDVKVGLSRTYIKIQAFEMTG